jgi:hypothetical protein
MVLLKTTLAGFALLLLGVLLLGVLGQYVTVEVRQVHRRDVEPHAEFLVGDMVDRSYSLPGGSDVLGTISVTEAPSNQTGDIRFLVFDAENYQRWSSGGQASFMYSAEKQGQFNFTFTSDKAGTYHFVFDNRASLYKKYVTLTIAYDEITTSRIPDPRVNYLSWALVIAGGLIFVYGLLRKPPIPWG